MYWLIILSATSNEPYLIFGIHYLFKLQNNRSTNQQKYDKCYEQAEIFGGFRGDLLVKVDFMRISVPLMTALRYPE